LISISKCLVAPKPELAVSASLAAAAAATDFISLICIGCAHPGSASSTNTTIRITSFSTGSVRDKQQDNVATRQKLSKDIVKVARSDASDVPAPAHVTKTKIKESRSAFGNANAAECGL